MIKFFLRMLSFMAIICILGGLAFLGILLYFGQDLPDYKKLEDYAPSVITRMYTKDGKLYAEFAKEKRIFMPINSIPKHIISTFLAVEDKNFFSHIGIDWQGIARAAFTNAFSLFTSNKVTWGGSTITQQVAKNFLLTRDKTLTRKIKELILTLRIERAFSKEKILELYLNEIYLGHRSYGIASAALNYFNKSLHDLTPEEAAYLAALPKAPSNYHPVYNKEAALNRRNWVIHRMQEEGILTEQQANNAQKAPLQVHKRPPLDVVDASYFAEHVRQLIIERYGEDTLYHGGLSVRTTLDSRLQKAADTALTEGLLAYDKSMGWRGPLARISIKDFSKNLKAVPRPAKLKQWKLAVVLNIDKDSAHIGFSDDSYGTIPFKNMAWAAPYIKGTERTYPKRGKNPRSPSDILSIGDVIAVSSHDGVFSLEQIPEVEGAIVALNPHTGRVLALDGGFTFKSSQFNRATQAQRQPGSAFKPFVYFAALDEGMTPASTILDAPVVIDIGRKKGLWKPRNISGRFYGKVTLRQALEQSYNASTIRTAQKIGLSRVREVAKRFGINKNLPLELAVTLGTEETTLLQLTAAYAILANGGKHITPIFIDRIQNRQGKTILRNTTAKCHDCLSQPWIGQPAPKLTDMRQTIADPIHCYQITSMLEGSVERGTGKRARINNYPIAGKTGTSNDYYDTWFIGYTADLVVGVFVGFDKPKSLGKLKTGATVTAPIFKRFMKKALLGVQPKAFPLPDNAQLVVVDRRTGKPAAKNIHTLTEVFSQKSPPYTTNAYLDLGKQGIY